MSNSKERATSPDVKKRAAEILKELHAEKYTIRYVNSLAYEIRKQAAEKARI